MIRSLFISKKGKKRKSSNLNRAKIPKKFEKGKNPLTKLFFPFHQQKQGK